MCVSHAGNCSRRRTCNNFATMVSSVTAMSVDPDPEIQSVLAPPVRHVSRMAS